MMKFFTTNCDLIDGVSKVAGIADWSLLLCKQLRMQVFQHETGYKALI